MSSSPTRACGINTPAERRAFLSAGILAALVFLMVGVGGYVRLSGSGLSIPHWPLINGSLLPPSDQAGWELLMDQYHKDVRGLEIPKVPGQTELAQFKTMFAIEYSHRALASLIGFVWLALAVVTWRAGEVRGRIGAFVWATGALIFMQALLGGLVVLKRLPAEKVALHLGVGFAIFALILWIMLRLAHPTEPGASRNVLRKLAHASLALAFIQVLFGGLVAGSGAGYMLNSWPRMGDYWVPPGMWTQEPAILNLLENRVTVQFIHRWLAAVVVAAVLAMVMRAMTLRVSNTARWALRAVFTVVILQFILGVLTLVMKVPVHLGLTHQMVGLVLFGLLTVIMYESKHSLVLAEEQQAAAQPTPAEPARREPAHA